MADIDDTTSPWTTERINEIVTELREHAREQLRRSGKVRPIAFLFCTRMPDGTPCRHFVPIVPETFGSGASKGAFAEAIAMTAEAMQAIALLFISEVWLLPPQALKPGETMDQVSRRWAGRVHQAPDREEAIAATFESHRHGIDQRYARITRDLKGRPTAGEYQQPSDFWNLPGEARLDRFAGRFVNLLPPVS
jgi:hypothetical protein